MLTKSVIVIHHFININQIFIYFIVSELHKNIYKNTLIYHKNSNKCVWRIYILNNKLIIFFLVD